MSTTLRPNGRSFRQRWKEFWFAPGDPTTLGFIRIVTGLLILYIHLAYSLDLQAFFGKYGWYGSAYIERERHEYPVMVGSFTDWDEGLPPPHVPDFPHRRQAVMRFIRGLPESKNERAKAVQYLDRISREENPRVVAGMTTLIRLAEASDADRRKLLDGLIKGDQFYIFARDGRRVYESQRPADRTDVGLLFPEFLLALPPADRKTVADDLSALLLVLPKDSTDAGYVIAHFLELDQPRRQSLVQFIASLPDDPAERNRLIDYLEYWNNDPRKLSRQGHSLVSVWFHVTDPTQMALIHGSGLVVMALFTIGFFTRVTGVMTWIIVVGYIHRTNQILFGMDTMMNILLVYLVVGSSGAALSVDRLIARYRAVRASLRRSGTVDGPTRSFLAQAPPSSGATLGIRLIQVHFCFIYMAAGLSKLKGPAWWNGFAFWDVMVNPEFTLLRYHWFEDLVRATASFKPMYFAITALGVWFTWGLEITFPFLVWTRLRPIMVWMGVLLHAGIGVLMGLNLFELLMMTMLLAYLPAGVIRDRLRGGTDLLKLRFGFNAADPRQARAAALVASADVDGQVTMEPAKDQEQPVVTAAGAASVGGTAGVSTLFRDLRLLRAFRLAAYVPGVSGVLARWIFPEKASSPPPPERRDPKTGAQAPATAS